MKKNDTIFFGLTIMNDGAKIEDILVNAKKYWEQGQRAHLNF